jgi:hypothetical protein
VLPGLVIILLASSDSKAIEESGGKCKHFSRSVGRTDGQADRKIDRRKGMQHKVSLKKIGIRENKARKLARG